MLTSYTPAELDRFRQVQQIAYSCAEETAAWLAPGVTERQAAAELRRRLVRAGVEDLFHVPFAWFGDRTAFRGFKVPFQFFPGKRRLAEGMPFVLDCAPVIDGYTADIGYGGVLGEDPVWEQLDRDLSELRPLVLDGIRAGHTLDAIYLEVDGKIASQGNDNRHRVYPGRVIGHQVTRQRAVGPKGVTMFGFGIRTLQTLGREFVGEAIKGRSPLWADGRMSRFVPPPGLWAVEPHIGHGPVGVKFEELLVITEDDAYWLDDDVPHVRRWNARLDATS
ncbi:aminopeptidase P family protein [Nocardioides marmoriginsengisoli]|uniref:Aminopeptidase P family protein n=1 Tax=Nocardioides marmoriginsengisoli TaxID=661483 RepID=A0A3N0CNM7_9ACTN|nr:M24 family metallopeptidase [Nocardioides marmoriginsengisoli]RNL65077.1 aminopeptidase P family protein [Nocardioides marmoriginsengisoli]